MITPKLILILSENWTLVPPNDLRSLVRMAQDAEGVGFDAVMVSEHVVLGRSSGAAGQPENPRDYALPENQDSRTPWPSSLLLLAAVAAATERIRLVAGAVIPPLRHPLLLAKELATLDVLSEGRLVVQPTVSWHRDEYEALGVPYQERGERLDEHLAAWRRVWAMSPASFEGRHYRFTDVFVEPKPVRSQGPPLWFGGARLHDRLLHRLIAYGSGFNPLGRPTSDDLARVRGAMAEAGRNVDELEMVGGTRGAFSDAGGLADLGEALEAVPAQVEAGFTSICIKPSQFTDDPAAVGGLCRDIVARVSALTA
jgi:probable F420-dependent oxidoreductase